MFFCPLPALLQLCERLTAVKHTKCLLCPDEEAFQENTAKTGQAVDSQANQSSYDTRDCVDFALTLLMFFSVILTILRPSQHYYIYIEPFLWRA